MSPLVCPACHGPLGGRDLSWTCGGCGAAWPSRDGFPELVRRAQVAWRDRAMGLLYDGFPKLHDPLTAHLLPLVQGGPSEPEMRRAYVDRLELDRLRPRPDGQPCHVLEVGVGAGGSIPYVLAATPADVDLVYWGLDLSLGMLREARRKRAGGSLDLRLLLGDAHRLPFADASMDRVLHVGAIGGFGDPRAALAEMARVAKPGAPIVVVDEELDPAARLGPARRLAFAALTFYAPGSRSPVDLLPVGAELRSTAPISPFYYGLSFVMPDVPRRSTDAP